MTDPLGITEGTPGCCEILFSSLSGGERKKWNTVMRTKNQTLPKKNWFTFTKVCMETIIEISLVEIIFLISHSTIALLVNRASDFDLSGISHTFGIIPFQTESELCGIHSRQRSELSEISSQIRKFEKAKVYIYEIYKPCLMQFSTFSAGAFLDILL
jgi:hypothetical protein